MRLAASVFRPVRLGAVTNGLAFAGLAFGVFSAVYDLTFTSYFIAKSVVGGGGFGAFVENVDRIASSFADALRDLTRIIVFRLLDFGIVIPTELYRYVTPTVLVLIRLPQMVLDFLLFVFLHRTLDDLDRDASGGASLSGGVDVASWTAAGVAIGGGVLGAFAGGPWWLVLGVIFGALVGAVLGRAAGEPPAPIAVDVKSRKVVRVQNRRRRFAASRNIALLALVAAAILAPIHAFMDAPFEARTSAFGCQKVDARLLGDPDRLATVPAGAIAKGANQPCECASKHGTGGPTGYTTRTKDYQTTRTEVLIICRIRDAPNR